MYQLGANDNEKETLIDCTSAFAVFFYQIKSFVSILEDESARFFAVSKSNSNADRNRGKTGVFLGEFIVDKPVAINNIVEEIRKFKKNQMIISKNPQFTGISARQQLEFTTHLLLTD